MTLERVGLGLFQAIAAVMVVLTAAIVWLYLTNPVTIATAMSNGEISPLVQAIADALLRALDTLLTYL